MNIYKIHGYYVCPSYILIKTSVLLVVNVQSSSIEQLKLQACQPSYCTPH